MPEAAALEHQQRGQQLQGVVPADVQVQRAVTGGQYLRRDQRQRDQQQAADHRPAPDRQLDLADAAFDPGHQPHHRDADQRAGQPQGDVDGVVARLELVGGGRRQRIGRRAQRVGHERPGQRGGGHRRQRRGHVGADDDLEGVERPGQRRAEGRGDRPGRAGADQGAHVGAAHAQDAAQLRTGARAHLGVGGLQPDRGAEAVGQQRLRGDDQVVAHRHAAAVQGVGFDRVDQRALASPRDERHQPDQQAAQRQHQQLAEADMVEHAQALVRRQAVQPGLQAMGHAALQDGQRRGDQPDQRGQADEPQVAGAELAAQPVQRTVRLHAAPARQRLQPIGEALHQYARERSLPVYAQTGAAQGCAVRRGRIARCVRGMGVLQRGAGR